MPIGELFLSAFLQVLFDRLASPQLLNFARREGIDKLLKKWDKLLTSINQVLVDAEDRQLIGDRGVKSWLEDLRDLAYDIEDLLDEFATESAKNESEAEPSTSKARSLLPSCCFRLSPRAIMLDRKMRSKIEAMDARLQEIITCKDSLNLRENNGQRSAHNQLDKLLPTTHLPEPCFVSREDEKSKILELLTGEQDDITCANPKVIPIVGMGGVGKTALAQQVYNDARVTGYFDVKAWTCVSDDFDVLAITKSMLGTINGYLSCEGKDLNWLQDKLRENLLGKKFLVVLDDVWNEKYGNWTTLLKPLQSGTKGSKIILTTRNEGVAALAGASPYYLKELSQDACMTLFAFHALGVGNFDRHSHLEELGQRIVGKCKGLPLAVKTLAGLLRTKASPHEWEGILNSKLWDLPEERNEILPALKLSYLHLPPNLRRCFAYCAIIPKDCEIKRDELIRWWSAEGLLEGKEGKSHWNAGLNYFNELVSRSLFEKLGSDGSRFLMHDLVNDLAKLVAGATYFDLGEFEGNHNNASLTHHASFIVSSYIVPKRLEIYQQMQALRSFISLEGEFGGPYLSQKVLSDLLSGLKYLRVLSLSHYYISEVPDCIGRLRHLRHLNLSYSYIEMLPKSIVELYNLEALMLQGCHNLIELPEGMEKLINLRFLDISGTSKLKVMPLCIGNLVGLEMLSKFVVGIENGSRLKELKNLQNLRGELCISDLHKVQEVRDAKDADLHMKEGLCRLTMQWSEDFEDFRDEELEAKVLDFLRPHQNLENLAISCYGGLEFPSWLGSPSHVNIVHLRLQGCLRAKALPSLGQLSSLKELLIEGINAICTVGPEFYGTRCPFPSLITLEFKNMPSWEDWSHYFGTEEAGVAFPHLERLVIQDCPKLIGRLPSQLNSLIKLEISSCPCMDASPSIISLPSLKELSFGGCNEGVLKGLVNLTSLTTLVIEDVAGLTWLSYGFTSSLIKLEKLEMRWCEQLTYLWQDRGVIRDLTCLKSLVVNGCLEFIDFVPGGGDIELPSNLETIKLEDCINLEKLPSKMHTLASLRGLTIEKCPGLMAFPETGIPTSVISLHISGCNMLQSLPIIGLSIDLGEPRSSGSNTQVDTMSRLQELKIDECDSLPASPFSEGRFFPATLKRLDIWSCRGVESLAEINVDHLQSLEEIAITDCENLRSLPQGLHTLSHLNSLRLTSCPALELECIPLPPSISKIHLWGCPKIRSLPNQLHRLTCLRDLAIGECESITQFPDGGLPPQLQRLEVYKCGNMKQQPVREWLTPLTSLQYLSIDGSSIGEGVGEEEEEEEEDLVLPLPSSLLDLEIYNMRNVERLSSTLPSSLRSLEFHSCPKLRELPQDEDGHGLPPSLERLEIDGCPILEQRCRKGTGYYWPLIRQIPFVRVGISLSGLLESITA